jgi:hypothetical protein
MHDTSNDNTESENSDSEISENELFMDINAPGNHVPENQEGILNDQNELENEQNSDNETDPEPEPENVPNYLEGHHTRSRGPAPNHDWVLGRAI